MKKISLLLIILCSFTFVKAQNVGINQVSPTNLLHITPINIGDNPLRIDNIQAYTVGDTSILVVNPATGVVKYMNASELSNSILNTTTINNLSDSLISNSTFINNFGDSLFLSQNFIDSLTTHLYINGDTLLYNNSFINNLRDSIDTDVDSVTLVGTILTVYENGGGVFVDLSSLHDADSDPTNEIELPTGGTTGQVLSTDGSANYTWVNDNGGTDNQTLSLSGNTLAISNGNSVTLTYNVNDADSDPTNEIQTISRTNNSNNITLNKGGGSILLPKCSVLKQYNTSQYTPVSYSMFIGPGNYTLDITCSYNRNSGGAYLQVDGQVLVNLSSTGFNANGNYTEIKAISGGASGRNITIRLRHASVKILALPTY